MRCEKCRFFSVSHYKAEMGYCEIDLPPALHHIVQDFYRGSDGIDNSVSKDSRCDLGQPNQKESA